MLPCSSIGRSPTQMLSLSLVLHCSLVMYFALTKEAREQLLSNKTAAARLLKVRRVYSLTRSDCCGLICWSYRSASWLPMATASSATASRYFLFTACWSPLGPC